MLVLLDVQVVCARQACSTGKLESEFRIVQRRFKYVRDNSALVSAHAENLALFIDTIDTVRRIMLGCDEDGLAGDVIHALVSRQ